MNFVRSTGDARSLAGLQLYQFEAYDKGQNLHLNADPTTVEVMNKMYREKKEKLKSSKANAILDKYGGQEHMEQLAPELLYAQTEQYVEYDRSGGVKRGGEKARPTPHAPRPMPFEPPPSPRHAPSPGGCAEQVRGGCLRQQPHRGVGQLL